MKASRFSLLIVLLISVFFVQLAANVSATISNSGSGNVPNFLRCIKNRDKSSSSKLSDSVFQRNDPKFPTFLQSYIRNGLFNRSTTPKPVAVIVAKSESHVQAAVVCAKSNDIELRIRSGGHDYEGESYVSSNPTFMVLDLSELKSITVNYEQSTVWAQAGATLGELFYHISNKSNTHAFPAGVCLTLGLSGHISGGGYGNMMRKYGLSVDNVLDAKVVTADGRIVVRKGMGEDLFWAIRGGGGASFCVVLAWKLRLVAVPEMVTVFRVGRTIEDGVTEIVFQWQEVATKLDHELFIRVQPGVQTVNNKTTVEVFFYGQYLGSADSLLSLLSEKLPLLRLNKEDCSEMPWVDSTIFWMDLPKGTPQSALLERVATSNVNVKRKSDYVQKPIPKAGLNAIWNKLLKLGNVYMQWNPYGGRMSEIPSNATAFPHRVGNLFKIQYLVIWTDDGIEAEKKNMMAVNKLHRFMTPYVSSNPREAFLNYRDIDVGTNKNGSVEFARSYFNGNLGRLMQVKSKVDPDNFFRYEQSIPGGTGYGFH